LFVIIWLIKPVVINKKTAGGNLWEKNLLPENEHILVRQL